MKLEEIKGVDLNTPEEKERYKDKPDYHNYRYGFAPYNVVIGVRVNTCMKCEKKFEVQEKEYDEARFVRFCDRCRVTVRKGNHDIDFTETVGD